MDAERGHERRRDAGKLKREKQRASHSETAVDGWRRAEWE